MILQLNQKCGGHSASRLRLTIQQPMGVLQPHYLILIKCADDGDDLVHTGNIAKQLAKREISGKKPSSQIHYISTRTWAFPPQFARSGVGVPWNGQRIFNVDEGFWEVENQGPASVRVEVQLIDDVNFIDF